MPKANFVLTYDMEKHRDVDYSSHAVANGKPIVNAYYFYCTHKEDAPDKARRWIKENPDKSPGIIVLDT